MTATAQQEEGTRGAIEASDATSTMALPDASSQQVKDHVVVAIPSAQDQPEAGAPCSSRVPPMGITWSDVNFSVKVKNPNTSELETKHILKNVSGQALPGELMVLMGPSGAGKSSLLDCIAARNPQSTGNVLVNGAQWNKSIARRTCYVMQDDLFYANLTVTEHLLVQAHLRMGKQVTKQDRTKRVEEVISELGLTKCQNTLIGGEMVKGISGGQRKRLSFATELLTNPSLLFVDEPTSGLDSFMAETVVFQMRDLAKCGRTIITTIHQPSSELFMVFDRLYLLADGHTVYDGKASASMEYFASVGHPCPSFMNPSDFYMQILVILDSDPDARKRVDALVQAWQSRSQLQAEQALQRQQVSNSLDPIDNLSNGNIQSLGCFQKLGALAQRNLSRLLRDVVAFRVRVAISLFITIMVGLIFLQLDLDQTGVQNFTGAIFFLCTSQVFTAANPEFVTVPLEIPLILREHNAGLYHGVVWYMAKNISELPFVFVYPAIMLFPQYFMIGFGANATIFFTFYLFSILLSFCGAALGYMVSCIVRRADTAAIVGMLFLLPFFLFGGLFLNADSTPDYFIWLQAISPIKYGFHGLMRAFWTNQDSIGCSTNEICRYHNGNLVLVYNKINPDTMWRDAVIMVALGIGFRLVGAVALVLRLGSKSNQG